MDRTDEVKAYESTRSNIQPFAIGTSQAYNASAAVSYSNLWCGNPNEGTTSGTMSPANYNPNFYYIPGADCCNFVSQCLYARGLPMKNNWTATFNTSGSHTDVSHSYRCSICEHTYTESHKMQIIIGAQICAKCGYTIEN